MKHSAIAASAIAAAGLAANHLIDGEAGDFAEEDALRDLYAYARQRSFPPPETLARKIGELIKKPFPFASIDEAPEAARVYFTAFRAVAQALEPFHEPDPEKEQQQPMQPTDQTPTGGDDVTTRTADGQKAMDEAIAESGGAFSKAVPPAPAPADEPPAKPKPEQLGEPTTKKK